MTRKCLSPLWEFIGATCLSQEHNDILPCSNAHSGNIPLLKYNIILPKRSHATTCCDRQTIRVVVVGKRKAYKTHEQDSLVHYLQ